jgi:hypothetical protein
MEIEKDPITPNYEGFKAHVLRLNTDMDPKNKWLVSRIAHQQEIRYKNLLDLRVKHSQAIISKTCSAGLLCVAQNGGFNISGCERASFFRWSVAIGNRFQFRQ